MFYSTCKVSKSFILSYIVTYEEVINIRSFKQKILVGTQTIDAEVGVGKVRHFPAPRCAHYKSFLDKERLIYFLKRPLVLTYCRRNGVRAHRTALKFGDDSP